MPAPAWLPGQRESSAITSTSDNGRSENADLVDWEDVKFSIEELAELYQQEDPFLWYITECCSASRKKGAVIVKKTRPHSIIQVGAISSFITSRNHYASGALGLPLGLWLFACQAHVDVKRVLCRFGYSVSDSTARNALTTLTDASHNALKEALRDATARGETEWAKISDNVQRYERVYEHGLGKENELKHGTACTAVRLDDCKPGAFRASDHITRVLKQERQTMTVESLYDSIDWEHTDNVTDLHFHRLEPRKKRLQPLNTNAEQQMENKGYQAGFRDSDEQMGIEPEKCDDLLSWNRADGGHGTLMRQKMIQVTTKDIYTSYRNAISTPETWHTKSTQLNSAVSNHYGPAASPDPSSLSRSSNAANMKRPTNLKKCDFYPTSQSMTMIWEARVLDCWRLVLGCDSDLLSHFDELADNDCLPTFDDLRWTRLNRTVHFPRSKFPQGSAWAPPTGPEASAAANDIDADMPGLDDDKPTENRRAVEEPSTEIPTTPEEDGPKIHKEPPGFDGDRVLSNAILFLMEFGWWIELNYAIPEGDVGRVFEILKYMLDLYALLEFECSPELKEALLNNWLLNLCAEIGKFVEGDLMQEWNNRWLTQISGQRGGDFDDKFQKIPDCGSTPKAVDFVDTVDTVDNLDKRRVPLKMEMTFVCSSVIKTCRVALWTFCPQHASPRCRIPPTRAVCDGFNRGSLPVSQTVPGLKEAVGMDKAMAFVRLASRLRDELTISSFKTFRTKRGLTERSLRTTVVVGTEIGRIWYTNKHGQWLM
ncbi:hypothetical protein MVEN_00102800 [Mycena venus]|uniref:DUF6589 domain-containing protein n=1 Tax=Mycena venus TaxID=2733690 RepID=A0A8H7DID0_9AGAR|nr:hypothetical protein MVEN_00102800 [Mycena venus]